MKNKIISCFLTVIIVVMTALSSVSGAEEEPADSLRGLDYFVKRICIFTHEDRANLETIFVPMLITDTGLDTLKRTISEYTPESESFFHVLLRKLVVRVDKEDLINSLSYLYMIDEKIREEYIGGFYERKETDLSAEGEAAMNNLMETVFLKYPDLRRVCEEDGINAKVIARFMKMFVDVNGGKALFAETSAGNFSINEIDSSLRAKVDAALLKNGVQIGGAGEFFERLCLEISGKLSSEDKKNFVVLGNAIGLVKKYKGTSSDGSTGNTENSNEQGEQNIKTIVTKLYTDNNNVSGIIVSMSKDGKTVSEGCADKFKVKFEWDNNIYLIDPDGERVRHFIRDGKECHAVLTKLGAYTFAVGKDTYFNDVSGWGKPYINHLYENGIISGKGNEMFAPEDNITREEFVKLIIEMFGLKGDYGLAFSDNSKIKWYYEYLSAAKFFEIADGFPDGSFGVGRNITRQDMCKVLYSVIDKLGINTGEMSDTEEFRDSDSIADYAYDSVKALKNCGIVSGDDLGNFNPTKFATRQEAAKIIYNILKCYVKN